MPFRDDLVPPQRMPRGKPSRYLLALLIVGIATLLRMGADPVLHDQVPYLLYAGAAVVATRFADVEGGILATVLGTFAGNYFFVATRYELDIRHEDLGAMLSFAVVAGALVWTVGRWGQSERRVRELQALTSAVLDQMPLGVMIGDASGTLEFGNAAMETIFGRAVPRASTIAEWRRHADHQSFFPDGRAMSPADTPMTRALRNGETIAGEELSIVRGDGTTRFLSSYAAPVRDDQGRTTGVVVAMLDMTDRKREQERLRQSEARFRSVVDGSRDVIYRVNVRSGRYEYISPSARDVVGYSVEELMAMDAEESLSMVHPDDLPGMRAALAHLVEAGSEESEYRQRTKAGEYRWMSNHMSLVRDAAGRPLYRDGNIRDVTGQKRLDVELRATVTELEQASRAKDEFLATLSHELRTPLNAILGWSDMLVRGRLAAGARERAIESIHRNARAQAALISDILDVSRIVSGKLRIDVRPLDLRDVVRAACEAIQPAADARGIEIRTIIQEHPAVFGDPDRLQQVLWNLLSNSVKFCDRGGRIDVDVRQVESSVRIRVEDDGAGIAPEFLPYVFERFRQADASTTRTRAGLGLGLAIVRHLVELHGGTVSAESAGKGRGATFTLTLPIRAVSEPAEGEEGRGAGAGAGARPISVGCLQGLRVVAVDDQDEARELARVVLEQFGATVTSCSTAEEALAAVAHDWPDVIVADIGMPLVDGYELMRRIRALPRHAERPIAAIALTAYGGAHDRRLAMDAGYLEHLAKPIMPDALVAVVLRVSGRADTPRA